MNIEENFSVLLFFFYFDQLLLIKIWAGGDVSLRPALLSFSHLLFPFSSSADCPSLCSPLSQSSLWDLVRHPSILLPASHLDQFPGGIGCIRCLVPLSSFSPDFQTMFLTRSPHRPLWTTVLSICSLLHVHHLPFWFLSIFISPPLSVFLKLPFPSSLCFLSG